LALAAVGVAVGAGSPRLDVVVLGDSFTATLDLATMKDDPTISWATGSRLSTPSIVQRLEAEGWDVRASNLATSGHRVRELEGQLARAPAHADLVIIWIGTNDLCLPAENASEFGPDLQSAFDAVEDRYPEARVVVFAPPSLPYIGRQHEAVPEAVRIWSGAGICTHFFGEARAAGAGADRQARFDAAMEQASAEHGFYHSAALQRINRPLAAWTASDYLHPSEKGLALFAERAWPDVQRAVGDPRDR
jgi:lysophospholipase L1-like esterase